MPDFPGVTHVALTVTDLGRSRPWCRSSSTLHPLSMRTRVRSTTSCGFSGSQTLVGIRQFPDPHGVGALDERRPGLDHLAFACREPGGARAVGVEAPTRSASRMAASSMLPMVQACPSVIRTTLLWGSSLPLSRRMR